MTAPFSCVVPFEHCPMLFTLQVRYHTRRVGRDINAWSASQRTYGVYCRTGVCRSLGSYLVVGNGGLVFSYYYCFLLPLLCFLFAPSISLRFSWYCFSVYHRYLPLVLFMFRRLLFSFAPSISLRFFLCTVSMLTIDIGYAIISLGSCRFPRGGYAARTWLFMFR